MRMVDLDDVTLPVLIAFLTAMIGAFFNYLNIKNSRYKELRRRELDRAQHIHDNIVKSLDRLYTHLKYDAWYIAMRRVKRQDDNERYLPWNDRDRWLKYKTALDSWRSNDMVFTSQVKAYFTDRENSGGSKCPCEMITEISKKIDLAARNIWKLYWEKKFCVGSSCAIRPSVTKPSSDSHKVINFSLITENTNLGIEHEEQYEITTNKNSTKHSDHTFEEHKYINAAEELMSLTEEEKVAKEYFDKLLLDIDAIFKNFSSRITRDIQDENVGKLRAKRSCFSCI